MPNLIDEINGIGLFLFVLDKLPVLIGFVQISFANSIAGFIKSINEDYSFISIEIED